MLAFLMTAILAGSRSASAAECSCSPERAAKLLQFAMGGGLVAGEAGALTQVAGWVLPNNWDGSSFRTDPSGWSSFIHDGKRDFAPDDAIIWPVMIDLRSDGPCGSRAVVETYGGPDAFRVRVLAEVKWYLQVSGWPSMYSCEETLAKCEAAARGAGDAKRSDGFDFDGDGSLNVIEGFMQGNALSAQRERQALAEKYGKSQEWVVAHCKRTFQCSSDRTTVSLGFGFAGRLPSQLTQTEYPCTDGMGRYGRWEALGDRCE